MKFISKYYKFIILIFLHISQTLFAQNPNPKGITIITHGFQLGGNFDPYWYNFAAAIKQRSGDGATIYTNNEQGQWVKLPNSLINTSRYGANGNGSSNNEIIFVLNWSTASDISINTINNDGYLESAADHLFAMLANPPSELNFTDGGIWNNTKPIHMIGHSRGTILNLQLCHRALKYFPSRLIDQYTSIDPHPANGLGISPYINNLINDVNHQYESQSLPGVYGQSQYPESISIKVPSNVIKSDSYFRKDGTYETGLDFDGISNLSAGNFNRKLKNEFLAGSLINGLDQLAHSNLHLWYLGTIDTLLTAPSPFYRIVENNIDISENPKFNETRDSTGFYFSRLGGGYNQLPQITNSINLSEMDNRIASRSNGKLSGLQQIFNGHFNYGVAGWTGSLTNDAIIENSDEKFLKINNSNGSATHNWLYFQPNTDYLTFKAKANQNFTGLGVTFYDGAWTQLSSTQLIINPSTEFKDYFVTIPPALHGKTGTFKLEWLSNNSNSEISIDDIDLTNNAPTPASSITALGETTFCNTSQTVQLIASTTNPDYEYQWQKNGSNIAAATDSIYTVNIEGDYSLKVISKSTGLFAISDSVKVSYKELTDYTVGGGGTVQVGEAIAFEATGGDHYLWEGPNGFVSNLQYPVRYSATTNMCGNYTVKITAKSGCSATANVSVNVIPVSGNSTNCPPLVRSVKSIDYSTLGSAKYTQPFSNDKYVSVLNKDNIYSLALLDSNLAVIWRKTLISNATELVTDNTNSIFLRIGNTISKYNSSGNLLWTTNPSIKINVTIKTRITTSQLGNQMPVPETNATSNSEIIVGQSILSMAQTIDGGVTILFKDESYKDYTTTYSQLNYNHTRTITTTTQYLYSPVNPNATGTEDYYVAKISSAGTIQWWKTYGDACTSDTPIKIKSTSNGGFLFMGKSCNNLLKTYRIDANGNTNWSNNLTLSNNADVPVTLSEASDGGALIGANIFRNNQYDMWFGKISSGGGLSWIKTFGNETIGDEWSSKGDNIIDIRTENNNFIVTGNLNSAENDILNPLNTYHHPGWLAKISQSGTTDWSRKYTVNSGEVYFRSGELYSISGNNIHHYYDFEKANFNVSSFEKLCLSQSIQLNSSVEYWHTSDYISYKWYSNGKLIPNNQTAYLGVSQNGTYHAKIEMSNGCSVVTPPVTIITPKVSSNAIYVYNTATNGYQYTSNGLCEGATLNLTAEGGDTYAWTGPNGFVSNEQNPSIPNITLANGGIYFCTISNAKRNCNVTLSTEAKVLAHPIAEIIGLNPIEEGNSIGFDIGLIGHREEILSVSINGPNGFSGNISSESRVINNLSLANAGTYTLNARVGNCIGTYTKNLIVNPCPLDPILEYSYGSGSTGYYGIIGPTNSFCINSDSRVHVRIKENKNDPNIFGYKFQWYRFGVPIQGENFQYLNIFQSGTYSLKVGRNGRCEKTLTFNIIVNYNPEFTTNIPTPNPFVRGNLLLFKHRHKVIVINGQVREILLQSDIQ